MHRFSKADVENAIERVCSILNTPIDSKLLEEYENGKHPNLLMYEKLRDTPPPVDAPAIQKYLIGSKSFLDQPCQYYDIFRAGRHVTFIQVLSEALSSSGQIDNHQAKYAILREARSYEEFEACLFELAVAHRYFTADRVTNTSFLAGGSSESPDLEVTIDGLKHFVECKRYNRSGDVVYQMRNMVKEKVHCVIEAFRESRRSAIVEISFHTHPQEVLPDEILHFSMESYSCRFPMVTKNFTVWAKVLEYQNFPEYVLFPSPKYFWERYGYKLRGEWFGLVNSFLGRFAHHERNLAMWKDLASTWVDDIEWECAIKWRITNDGVVDRLRRLNYKRIFKGLSQLRACSPESSLHVWIERDYPHGHRQKEMVNLYKAISSHGEDVFSWLIFDETCLDVSPKGSFDLIEHAHFISGPTARQSSPLVTNVFTHGARPEGHGEFGIGDDLPDIDSLP